MIFLELQYIHFSSFICWSLNIIIVKNGSRMYGETSRSEIVEAYYVLLCMYKKKTFIPQTYETLTLQRVKGGKVSVAKRQFGGSPWFARQRVLPDYTDEESQEKQRDRESESDNFARRCRRVEAA